MSEKNLDRNGRWRNITVTFRVSPEENERINAAVRISGLTKQEYITRRLEDMEVVVQGNPKVFWGLREELRAVAEQNSCVVWRVYRTWIPNCLQN